MLTKKYKPSVKANNELKEEAVRKAIENAEMEIPEPMIVTAQHEEMRRLEGQLQSYGMNIDQYLKYMGVTAEQYMENIKPQAEANVKRDLVMDAIAKEENIEAAPEEIDKVFADAAQAMNIAPEKAREMYAYATDSIIADIKRNKAMDLVAGNAVQVEKAAEESSENNG